VSFEGGSTVPGDLMDALTRTFRNRFGLIESPFCFRSKTCFRSEGRGQVVDRPRGTGDREGGR